MLLRFNFYVSLVALTLTFVIDQVKSMNFFMIDNPRWIGTTYKTVFWRCVCFCRPSKISPHVLTMFSMRSQRSAGLMIFFIRRASFQSIEQQVVMTSRAVEELLAYLHLR